MLINEDWQKHNPINDTLEPHENLLWIGRPNEEIYVRGKWNQRGVFKYWALSVAIFIVATICLFISCGFASHSMIPVLFFTVIVGFTPLAATVLLESKDYKKAPWYALSEKRIFMAFWNDEDNEPALYSTELSNVKEMFVKKLNQLPEPGEADKIGTLVCIYSRPIPRRAINQFTFELIDNPAEVQALLVGAKAASRV